MHTTLEDSQKYLQTSFKLYHTFPQCITFKEKDAGYQEYSKQIFNSNNSTIFILPYEIKRISGTKCSGKIFYKLNSEEWSPLGPTKTIRGPIILLIEWPENVEKFFSFYATIRKTLSKL